LPGIPYWYLTKPSGILSLAIPPWVGAMSTGDGIGHHQWHRNRGFRRFNEPGPPSSWGPRVVGPHKIILGNKMIRGGKNQWFFKLEFFLVFMVFRFKSRKSKIA